MAHFAQIDTDDVVQQVIIVANSCLDDKDFPLSEPLGQAFIADTLKLSGLWKQTSYNSQFRGRYAGIGDIYDADLDEFVTPEVEE
jgi:hypothetical protein